MTKPIQIDEQVHARIVALARADGRYVGAGSKSQLGQFVADACMAYPAAKELAEVVKNALASHEIVSLVPLRYIVTDSDKRDAALAAVFAALEAWRKANGGEQS